ncbi:MAG: hypothetical protein CL911_00540 [Deltaproteobacteria bacterium]|nr:hypothetical protein [Deltaproteobacteria bacterium]
MKDEALEALLAEEVETGLELETGSGVEVVTSSALNLADVEGASRLSESRSTTRTAAVLQDQQLGQLALEAPASRPTSTTSGLTSSLVSPSVSQSVGDSQLTVALNQPSPAEELEISETMEEEEPPPPATVEDTGLLKESAPAPRREATPTPAPERLAAPKRQERKQQFKRPKREAVQNRVEQRQRTVQKTATRPKQAQLRPQAAKIRSETPQTSVSQTPATTTRTTTRTTTTTPKVATTSAQTQTSLPKPEQRQVVTVTTEAQADPDAEASSATPTAKTAPLAPQAPEAETVAAVSERTSASSSSRPSTVAAVRSGGKGQVVNIADLDLQELENLSLEDLRQLAELLPEGESSRDGSINVKDLLAKLKGAKLDLTRIRAKTQRLTSQKLEGVTEALEGTEEIYSKGRSKIHRKPPPLNVVQAKAYLPKIDELLRKDWKLPVEMDPELRVRVSVVVRRDGMVLQYELIKLSGNEFFDESVRRLFAKTEMLLPLPMDFEAHAAEIDLRFRP